MHDDTAQVASRLRRFVDERLRPAVVADRAPLDLAAWEFPGEPVPAAEALTAPYAPVREGHPWGAAWSTTWLRLRGPVPSHWRAEDLVDVAIDLGFTAQTPGFQAEGLALAPDGRVLKGVSPRNHHVPLALTGAAPGGTVELYVEAAGNPTLDPDFTFAPTPLGDPRTLPADPLYRLGRIELVRRDPAAWGLLHDVIALRGLVEELDRDSTRRHEVLRALERMLDAVDPADVAGTAADGRAELAAVLARPAAPSAPRVRAAGHAHIDSAWLWPFRETRRKLARTYANALALMDEYPEFVFVSSSAQHLAWVKADAPELFERLRARAAEGRFVPVGGMWVESDTMMPGAESMVRQFLEGQDFFAREFGAPCAEVWLPDSFGYSGALPQIAVGAGARWFLTQKMSWNDTNRMPHHTLRWEGIDGTRIFTHFPPVDNYNCDLSPRQLLHGERTYAEKGRGTLSLAPSGWGDGGGGPTRDHAEAARRAADLEGLPRVEWESPAGFFADAEAELPDAAVWSGEMYLELHRGIFTSQARTKRGNRRGEALLREAELWCATAAVRAGAPYPDAALRELWQTVLLHQFHDVLPGSSIAWVYADVEREQARVAARAEELIAAALAALTGGPGGAPAGPAVVLNAGPLPVAGVPALGGAVAGAEPVPGAPGARPWAAPTVVAGLPDATPTAGPDGSLVLDDGRVRAVVDDAGFLVSLVDLASGRDAVAPDDRARFALHRDLPNRWDAWDVDAHHRRVVADCDAPATVRVEGDAVVVVRPVGTGSTVTQRLRVLDGALRLDLDVDWHERERLLKLVLPLDLRAEHTSAETQFGHVRRVTHENTSWDAARFEVPTQRWLHLAEGEWGVAVANHAVYGYDVTRHVRSDRGTTTLLGLSLLRGPRYPDPDADQGEHAFALTLRPGAGIAQAVADGYALHLPLRRVPGSRPVEPLVRVDGPGVLVEAVKLAHDGGGDVVVRLYESRGERRSAVLHAAFADRAWTTDLLERPDGEVEESAAGGVALRFRPFEIRTVRLSPRVA